MKGYRFSVAYRSSAGETNTIEVLALNHEHAHKQVRDHVENQGIGGPVLSTEQLGQQHASPLLAS